MDRERIIVIVVLIIIGSLVGVYYYTTFPTPSPTPSPSPTPAPTPTPTPPKPPPLGPFWDLNFDLEASSGFDAAYLYEGGWEKGGMDAFNLSRGETGTIILVFTSNINYTIEFEFSDLQVTPPPPPSGIELKVEPKQFSLKPDEETIVNLIIKANPISEELIPLQSEVSISFDFKIIDMGTEGGVGRSFLLIIV